MNVPPSPEELNAKELTRRRAERERVIFQEYVRIYHRCNKKIKEADGIGRNEVVFAVPLHCPAVPGYKQDLCEKVVIHKLVQNDFTVESLGEGKIKINWDLPDFDELLREEERREKESKETKKYTEPPVGALKQRKPFNPFARMGNLSSGTDFDSESDSPLSLDKIRTMKNYMSKKKR